MKLTFSKLRFKNFLSYGAQFTEIDLLKTNTTLITGKNGAGKSVLLDAITFALYGKPFRNINKPQLVNSINGKDCVVEVEFETRGKNYLIRRGIKPAIFEIYENGNLINQVADNRDYQSFFESNIIGMTYKAFTQICVLGKANYTPFMALAAADRRKIVEDLLDLNMFSLMNTYLKEDISTLRDETRETKFQLELTTSILEEKRKTQSLLQENVDDLVANINSQITLAQSEMEALDAEMKEIGPINKIKLQQQKDSWEAQRSSFIALSASVRQGAGKLKKEIAFFHENQVCPTCSQSITEQFRTDKVSSLTSLLDDHEKGVKVADGKLAQFDDALAQINEAISVEQEKENKKLFVIKQIAAKKTHIDSLNKQLLAATNRHTNDGSLANEISDLEIKFTTLENQMAEQSLQKEVLDIAAVLLKDGGIKTKIIAQYIPIMNQLLAKYLNILDFYTIFELNETFSESVKSRNMETFTYNSFSEGQKARIELALMFTWRELASLRNNASTNLLILDEVFDGSLESDGKDGLFNILQEVSKNTNIFVITHTTDVYVEKFDRELRVNTVKNFSTLKEIS